MTFAPTPIEPQPPRPLISAAQPPFVPSKQNMSATFSSASGITWQDFGEFQPIPGLNQIFAHTPAATVRMHSMLPSRRHVLKRAHRLDRLPGEVVTRSQSSCVNVCLDTELPSVALIENGALTIFAEELPGQEQLIVRC